MKNITKNPVKYAILTLREKKPGRRKPLVRGKIVSKCYLLEERELKFPNGVVEKTYFVNFPYNDIKTYEDTMFTLKPTIGEPSFDKIEEVENVYDTYEEAKEALKKVKKVAERTGLLRVRLSGDNWKEDYAKAKKLLKINNEICSLYEAKVLEATEDMTVDKKGFQKSK